MSSFESGFADVQKAAETAAQAAANLAKTAKDLARAAREGNLAQLRKTAERLGKAHDVAAQEVSNARDAWPFSEQAEEDYLRNGFTEELLSHGKTAGLRIFPRGEGLVCFPSLLKVAPAERAIRVDRKRVSALRPSFLVAALQAAQSKKPKLDPARFLESLFRAYQLLLGDRELGATVPLDRVYEVLTLLPGSGADYGKDDFGRDLLMLDQGGVAKTKSGAIVSLPASTGTKGSRTALSIVGPDGNLVTFYGLRFVQGDEP